MSTVLSPAFVPALVPAIGQTVGQTVVSIDLGALLPVLAPAGGAAVVLVADVVSVRMRRPHYVIALVSLVVGAFGTIGGLGAVAGDARQTLCLPGAALSGSGSQCLYAAGSVASALQLAALLAAAVTLLLAWPQDQSQAQPPGLGLGGGHDLPVRGLAGGDATGLAGGDATGLAGGDAAVAVSLLLAATAGATAVAGAQDLGSWLVALELATLPTVALVALRGARSAISGAVALLTTSLVSFALLALAAALWYTATGSALLTADAALSGTVDAPHRSLLVLAVVLVVAGIGFKLSLVPFHAWTPEAYAGAPLPIATFLAATSKVAALAALLVVVRAIAPLGAPVLTAVAVVSAVSMTLGNVVALRERNAVRLLAWSTVAQAGWVVLPLATVSSAAAHASGAYLLAYVIATVLAFAVIAAFARIVGTGRGPGRSAYDLASYRGLLRQHPVLGCALALALLSLAGLPPGILGVVAKVVALRPVVAGELWLLAVIAAVNAVLGVAVYLRWLILVVAEPTVPMSRREAHHHVPHPAVLTALGLSAGALVVTSLAPQLVLGLLGP